MKFYTKFYAWPIRRITLKSIKKKFSKTGWKVTLPLMFGILAACSNLCSFSLFNYIYFLWTDTNIKYSIFYKMKFFALYDDNGLKKIFFSILPNFEFFNIGTLYMWLKRRKILWRREAFHLTHIIYHYWNVGRWGRWSFS